MWQAKTMKGQLTSKQTVMVLQHIENSLTGWSVSWWCPMTLSSCLISCPCSVNAASDSTIRLVPASVMIMSFYEQTKMTTLTTSDVPDTWAHAHLAQCTGRLTSCSWVSGLRNLVSVESRSGTLYPCCTSPSAPAKQARRQGPIPDRTTCGRGRTLDWHHICTAQSR